MFSSSPYAFRARIRRNEFIHGTGHEPRRKVAVMSSCDTDDDAK
jgi:hypothetical protein